jgi:hypothetical protein
VRGDVDGSVTRRCRPRNTALGISESTKYGTPVVEKYAALHPKRTTDARPEISVIEKLYIAIRPIRNSTK